VNPDVDVYIKTRKDPKKRKKNSNLLKTKKY